MFSPTLNAQTFLETLSKLSKATQDTKPKALNSGIERILKQAEGFVGKDIEALITHISEPPKKIKKSTTGKSKLRPHSTSLIEEIVAGLKERQYDDQAFANYAHAANKSCGVKTIKAVASSYAISTEPPTKKAAFDLILRARATYLRAEEQAKISANAKPW